MLPGEIVFFIGILLSLAYTNIHSFLTPFVNFKIYFELFPIVSNKVDVPLYRLDLQDFYIDILSVFT